MPGRELLLVDGAQLTGYLLKLVSSRWYGMQAFSVNVHGVIENTVNKASVSIATPGMCAVFSCGMC